MKRHQLTWANCRARAQDIAQSIYDRQPLGLSNTPVLVYGIPRGGIFAALLVQTAFESIAPALGMGLVESPERAKIIIDDIVDTGATRLRILANINPLTPFYALAYKTEDDCKGVWVEFPWERMSNEQGPEENVVRMLQYIGEDPQREGLRETPQRVVKSWGELFSGYRADVASLIKTFDGYGYGGLIVLKGIEFYSCCEHHLLPFVGVAHIAYIPNGKVIGISKLARVLEAFSRRLQVQENLTEQITQALDEHLKPKGSACVIEAKHLCMTCRGVNKQGSTMITSSLTGAFLEAAVRAEFFNLVRS